jgi:hypothetical protein
MSPASVNRGDLAQRLRNQTSINDPFTGEVAPADAQMRSKLWPEHAHWQQVSLTGVVEQGLRRIEEYVFTGVPGFALTKMGVDLPVAIVFERDGKDVSHARVYSAHELVTDRHRILPVDEHLVGDRGVGDILAKYFHILHAADPEATAGIFDADGYMQHSNGERHTGHAALLRAFTKFYQNGAIRLKYCNKTDSGPITAFECYMPSGRPACAIYERSKNGLSMHAARLYL